MPAYNNCAYHNVCMRSITGSSRCDMRNQIKGYIRALSELEAKCQHDIVTVEVDILCLQQISC